MREECYIAPAVFGRFVIVHAQNPELGWTGLRWVSHRKGLAIGSAQVINLATRQEAIDEARAAHMLVRLDGYRADDGSITCFACGMTSYSAGDVRAKYCGNCHKFHEVRIPLEGTVS